MRSLHKLVFHGGMTEQKLQSMIKRRTNRKVKKDVVPYGLQLINAKTGWAGSKGEGVVVAVLDTGADHLHPDLAPNIIGGRNFVPGYPENDIRDWHGHGTHVAGTIAAAENHYGIVGVAPKTKLLIGRVLSPDGFAEDKWIAQAIRWATRWRGPAGEKVNIINMSLGGPKHNPGIHKAIKAAVKAQISVVCAAGNEGDGKSKTVEVSYPAYYPEVIAVGAVNQQKNIVYFSNTNKEIDVAAPGFQILSTLPSGKYGKFSGTSMAAPHVSGFAAIIISKYRKRLGTLPKESEVFSFLKYLTKDVAELGIDASAGAGLISFLP